jgi:heme-degrading monooxygenase HmoA
MIARMWQGLSTAKNADSYTRHLSESVFPRLRSIVGYQGAYLLRRDLDGRANFLVLTMWESMQAVRRFAGDAPETAVVEPEARAVLSEFDPTVKHYEVVLSTGLPVVPPLPKGEGDRG